MSGKKNSIKTYRETWLLCTQYTCFKAYQIEN